MYCDRYFQVGDFGTEGGWFVLCVVCMYVHVLVHVCEYLHYAEVLYNSCGMMCYEL